MKILINYIFLRKLIKVICMLNVKSRSSLHASNTKSMQSAWIKLLQLYQTTTTWEPPIVQVIHPLFNFCNQPYPITFTIHVWFQCVTQILSPSSILRTIKGKIPSHIFLLRSSSLEQQITCISMFISIPKASQNDSIITLKLLCLPFDRQNNIHQRKFGV